MMDLLEYGTPDAVRKGEKTDPNQPSLPTRNPEDLFNLKPPPPNAALYVYVDSKDRTVADKYSNYRREQMKKAKDAGTPFAPEDAITRRTLLRSMSQQNVFA